MKVDFHYYQMLLNEGIRIIIPPENFLLFRFSTYRINLASNLDAGKQVTVTVETVHSHTLKPYPSQITQAEKQLVQFQANVLFLSPYKTTTQTTTITCASNNIESYTKTVKPVHASDSTITYGPFEDKAAFSQVSMLFINKQGKKLKCILFRKARPKFTERIAWESLE